METHHIHPELLQHRVRVLVVGCGGTGSALVSGLPYLQHSLLAYGHPAGLKVTVMDGDVISPTNCIRQPFARSEIGLSKAIVLVNRLNIFWGLDWEAVPEHVTGNHPIRNADILIGCVDTRAARSVIERQTSGDSSTHYAFDVGNSESSGQFILGEPLNAVNRRSRIRLRTASELFPELTDSGLDDDGQPSCSALESLDRQHPYINQALAYHALALLSRLFRLGEISYHGGFLNLESGQCVPLRPDPQVWRRITKFGRRGSPSA
jgi:sulfur-carrier protein adenylyltransferase/sulfurtransferase